MLLAHWPAFQEELVVILHPSLFCGSILDSCRCVTHIYTSIQTHRDTQRERHTHTQTPTHPYTYTDRHTQRRKEEGNVLFNDTLNTFYLRLYGVGHMVKNHTDSERANLLPPHGLLFPISSIIPQTGLQIPQPLLQQSWSTGWNEK